MAGRCSMKVRDLPSHPQVRQFRRTVYESLDLLSYLADGGNLHEPIIAYLASRARRISRHRLPSKPSGAIIVEVLLSVSPHEPTLEARSAERDRDKGL
jgi:hypothetical protein